MSAEKNIRTEQSLNHIESIVQQYPEVAGLQAYEYFRSDALEQADQFINGNIETLDLTYPALNLANVTRLKEPMVDALTSLMPDHSEKSEALFSTIEYRYSELFMIDMARVMTSGGSSEEDKAEAAKWFKDSNEGLYGAPQKNVFDALAKEHLLPKLEPRDTDTPIAQELRNELADLLGDIDDTEYQLFVPSEELVKRIGALVHERFDPLVDHIDPESEYDADQIADVLQTVLDKIGASELGWTKKIIPNTSSMGVSAHQKQVEVGANHPAIKGSVLKGKALHEYVHIIRSINAERASWPSAAYGQDDYLKFEEGLATALEDAYSGEFSDHGTNYYLVAGLAYGLDNHEPRAFREVYEIIWRSRALNGKNQLDEAGLAKAKTFAFKACLRMFKGTDTKHPGLTYLNDTAYKNGQELAWPFLDTVKNQSDLDIAFAGKLDLSRDDHLVIAHKILDAESET